MEQSTLPDRTTQISGAYRANYMKILVTLATTVLMVACGGDDTGTSPGTSPRTDGTAPAARTFTGTVTNIVTGAKVQGAKVTIGEASGTSGADGSYSLEFTDGGEGAPFRVEASGYHTRESSVSLNGSKTINLTMIPIGNGFDLAFFDETFREPGRGTRRWATQPAIEIWTQQLSAPACSTSGPCKDQVTADATPDWFEKYAREAIAEMSDLSGGTMNNPVITLKTFAVGTQIDRHEASGNIRFKYIKAFPPPYANNGGATGGQPNDKNEMVDAPIRINGTYPPRLDRPYPGAIFWHEFAHAMGFIPGHPQGVPNVRGPSIMGPDPVVVTDKDRLHAKILYQRPAGSASPDRDPFGVNIN